MASIAIIGPGALGGMLAAWLAQSPKHDITLCVRTPFRSLRVQTPAGELTANSAIVTAADPMQPMDWVIVTTKTYDVPSVAPWLKALVGPHTRVAVVQNGVEHVARFAGLVPEAVIVPVVADIPASRLAPGEIVQQRMGWMVVPEGQNGADYVDLFAVARSMFVLSRTGQHGPGASCALIARERFRPF